MNSRRVNMLRNAPLGQGPVLYWMHRDFRAADNWGLTYARLQALKSGQPVAVIFCLPTDFAEATAVHFHFLLDGLLKTAQALRRQNIPISSCPAFLALNARISPARTRTCFRPGNTPCMKSIRATSCPRGWSRIGASSWRGPFVPKSRYMTVAGPNGRFSARSGS